MILSFNEFQVLDQGVLFSVSVSIMYYVDVLLLGKLSIIPMLV